MTCKHDDYELTAEDLELDTCYTGYNTIHQHFICLGCGAIGNRTYRIPVEITWNGNQSKLDFE
jgi:Fe2+ or Zn2+ uptake regulation protein